MSKHYDVRHAIDVARRVSSDEARVVALLHDAVEDGACRAFDLEGLPETVVNAVILLTRKEGSYERYIDRIIEPGDALAIEVKRADVDANLARMDKEHESLSGRYRNAEQRLLVAALELVRASQ